MSDKKNKIEQKEDLLSIIEDDSSKEDFIHWIINHTDATIPNTERWADIKKEVLENEKISVSLLRDYSITLKNGDDIQDAIKTVKDETDKARKVAEKLTFIGFLGKFAIAIGGIILFIGLINIAATFLIFARPDFFDTIKEPTLINIIGVFLGFGGFFQVIGGLLLMTK